ncbi:MAG: hypothetical protein ACRD3Q_03995, partial [Terriglobales bacterium]
DHLFNQYGMSDVDAARLLTAVRQAEDDPAHAQYLTHDLVIRGAAAVSHFSGQRDLSVSRIATHNLIAGQVRLGHVVPVEHGTVTDLRDFGVDHDTLATSLLALGPPGPHLPRDIGLPIVEHLCLSALANSASVVVLDGDEAFDRPGWFDITIDPHNPAVRYDIYSTSASPDAAAEYLTRLLLPPGEMGGHVTDVSRNALYACLGSFYAAFTRWPTTRQLLGLLQADALTIDSIAEALPDNPDGDEWRTILKTHAAQSRDGYVSVLIARLSQLDRPTWQKFLDDGTKPVFDMRSINRPVRMRIALPRYEHPEVSRLLARSVINQFIEAATSNRPDDILKCLVVNNAGDCIDSHIAASLHRLRSHNAGIALLTHTLSDIPAAVRPAVFGNFGGKIVLGGIDPADADIASTWFGAHDATKTAFTHIRTRSHSGQAESVSTTTSATNQSRWAPADITHGLPARHAIAILTRRNGEQSTPALVTLEA